MSQTASISPKLEDYLEVILHLVDTNRVARVSDIAGSMGVQMPTVTGVLRHLSEHGLVNYEPYQFVTLTALGAAVARGMVRRHTMLKKFMVDVLDLPEKTAEGDACGMEHAVSEETLTRLTQFVECLETCPEAPALIAMFRGTCGAAEAGGPESGSTATPQAEPSPKDSTNDEE